MMKIGRKRIALTDASHCAQILYERYKANILEAFRLSLHGQELVKRGFGEDLIYCAQIDITDVIPQFKEGVIRTDRILGKEDKG
jgi:2-phosphosulfolactate phosphatase